MPIKYRYKISDGTNDVGCFPLYASASMVTDMETDQVFYRTKFSGTMTFIGEASNFIRNSAIDTRFEIQQQKYNFSTGKYGDTIWTGEFWKTDCKFDVDENTVEVQPQTVDQYTELLKGLDKEYDLVSLRPKIDGISLKRQPIFQVYIAGEELITNYLGGFYWEQPVDTVITDTADLEATYHFDNTTYYYIPAQGASPDISGEYTYFPGVDDYIKGDYTIYFSTPNNRWEIKYFASIVFTGTTGESDVFSTIFSGSGIQTKLYKVDISKRILTNVATIGGNATSALPADDIITSSYTRAIALPTTNIIFDDNVITIPTIYGKADVNCPNITTSNAYFTYAVSAPVDEKAYPVNRSRWDCYSLWFHLDDTLRDYQEEGSSDVFISTCYHLFECLKVLIGEIDPTITVNLNTTSSSFYYDTTNPIDGVANLDYYLTPKSNVTTGDYDLPASKANIKLSDLLRSLWAVHKVKWHIDGDKNFIVEHVNYYEQGGSYIAPVIGTDITLYNEPQTDRAWGYKQNTYTYEKQEMPERYEYKWMDETSVFFDGYPIKINSAYTNSGQIKKENASIITTDIDYIFVSPSSINEQGFVFMGTSLTDVHFYELSLGGILYKMQNGRLSYAYLHPNFHKYSLPATDIEVNDNTTTADSVKRTKIQTVTFVSELAHDPMTLITTLLGTGKAKTITEDLNDGQKTITVYHDTN